MHIVIGLVVGSALGVLAGSAAIHLVAPQQITVQANQANKSPAVAIPADRYFDI